jgi:hypothetical protein
MNWQPIGEAPKDGTSMLCWTDAGSTIGWWDDRRGVWSDNGECFEIEPTYFCVIAPPSEQQSQMANEMMVSLAYCRQRMREQAAMISELKATLVSKRREQQTESVNQRLLQAAEVALKYLDFDLQAYDEANQLAAAIEAAKQATK